MEKSVIETGVDVAAGTVDVAVGPAPGLDAAGVPPQAPSTRATPSTIGEIGLAVLGRILTMSLPSVR
jgi:hypothetical protein